jgi:hypothetical protein
MYQIQIQRINRGLRGRGRLRSLHNIQSSKICTSFNTILLALFSPSTYPPLLTSYIYTHLHNSCADNAHVVLCSHPERRVHAQTLRGVVECCWCVSLLQFSTPSIVYCPLLTTTSAQRSARVLASLLFSVLTTPLSSKCSVLAVVNINFQMNSREAESRRIATIALGVCGYKA